MAEAVTADDAGGEPQVEMCQVQAAVRGLRSRSLDVDLSQPLSDAAFAEIERAFFRGQVLALRGQTLTPRAVRSRSRAASARRSRT